MVTASEKKKIGRRVRRQGKVHERAAAKYLSELLGVKCRRTAQHKGGPGSPDIVVDGIDSSLHIEVKGGAACTLGSAWLDQCCQQALADGRGKPWCVLWRPKGSRQWLLTMGEGCVPEEIKTRDVMVCDYRRRITFDTDESIKAELLLWMVV